MPLRKPLLLIPLALLLSACLQTPQAPRFPSPMGNTLVSGGRVATEPDWLTTHQHHVTRAIQQAVLAKHPNSAQRFPQLRVSSVTLFNQDPSGTEQSRALQSANQVLSAVSNRLKPAAKRPPVWRLALELEYFTKPNNPRSAAPSKVLAHTGVAVYRVMCWQKTLAFCPITADLGVAEVRGTVTTDTGKVIELTAHGGSPLNDTQTTRTQAQENTRMLVSALGDLSVKLAEQLK